MRDHTSPSQINMFLRCPRQFWWRYIEGIKAPPGVAMVVGSSVHAGAAEYLRLRMEQKTMDPDGAADKMLAASRKLFKTEIQQAGDDDLDPKFAATMTDKLVQAYPAFVGKSIGIPYEVEAEHKVNLKIEDVPEMICKYDVVERRATGEARISDLKVQMKPSPFQKADEAKPDHTRQLRLYAMAWASETAGNNIPRLRVDYYLPKKDTIVFKPITIIPEPAALVRLTETLLHMERMIKLGLFPRMEDGWWCNSKWCGFYTRCMAGEGKGA